MGVWVGLGGLVPTLAAASASCDRFMMDLGTCREFFCSLWKLSVERRPSLAPELPAVRNWTSHGKGHEKRLGGATVWKERGISPRHLVFDF